MASPRGEQYGDEEMKVRVQRGCVVDISKTLDPAEADGENVGIAKFGAAGSSTDGQRFHRFVEIETRVTRHILLRFAAPSGPNATKPAGDRRAFVAYRIVDA